MQMPQKFSALNNSKSSTEYAPSQNKKLDIKKGKPIDFTALLQGFVMQLPAGAVMENPTSAKNPGKDKRTANAVSTAAGLGKTVGVSHTTVAADKLAYITEAPGKLDNNAARQAQIPQVPAKVATPAKQMHLVGIPSNPSATTIVAPTQTKVSLNGTRTLASGTEPMKSNPWTAPDANAGKEAEIAHPMPTVSVHSQLAPTKPLDHSNQLGQVLTPELSPLAAVLQTVASRVPTTSKVSRSLPVSDAKPGGSIPTTKLVGVPNAHLDVPITIRIAQTKDAEKKPSAAAAVASPMDKSGATAKSDQAANVQITPWNHASFSNHLAAASTPQTVTNQPVLHIQQVNANQALGDLVLQQVQAGPTEVRVKVHPEGMGDIVVSVVKHGDSVHIRLEANQMQTMQWLAGQTDMLSQTVKTTGVDVKSVQVAFGQASLSQNFSGDQSSKRQREDNTSFLTASIRKAQTDAGPRFVVPLAPDQTTHINLQV